MPLKPTPKRPLKPAKQPTNKAPAGKTTSQATQSKAVAAKPKKTAEKPVEAIAPEYSNADATLAAGAPVTFFPKTGLDPFIRIRGARTHNLKNINLDIPRNQLVVITGLSGSGKSSLAFDTLFAEGQRRYVESLSAYARQFLQLMEKPDVDLIEGLSPAIAIEQKTTSHNPRSTVGTVTEIHDYLRLLFARAGDPYCPDHNVKLEAQSVAQMVDHALALPADTRVMVLAPVITERKGEHLDLIETFKAKGFVRLRVNGKVCEIDSSPKLDKNKKHTIELVVDRLKIAQDAKQRLAESFETALLYGNSRAILVTLDDKGGSKHETLFSSKFACRVCDYSLAELEPRLFSFNSPMGACPTCDGLGEVDFFDPKRVVTTPQASLENGAIRGWDKRNQFYFLMLTSLADYFKFDLETPFEKLSAEAKHSVLYGSGDTVLPFSYIGERGKIQIREHPFEGVIPNLERRWRETESQAVREELAKYIAKRVCTECLGARVKREARHVLIAGRKIHEISALPLRECQHFFSTLTLDGSKAQIAEKIVREISSRLGFLNNVGLDYLSLGRSAQTLSGGEAQRIRLASQIGSGLTGVMYLLDEPSIGLHQRDNDRLIATLRHLRELGNTVVMVEHDEDAIWAADYVVDIGPGAGEHGGQIIAVGTPAEVAANAKSLTGQYLSRVLEIELPSARLKAKPDAMLRITGARGNNLQGVTLELPVGLLTCVTGVSGSGKSTLINDTLSLLVARTLNGANVEPAPFDEVEGIENFDKIIDVDQSPIGRTPRSNPATYTGLFGPMRDLFAAVPEARARGYGPGRFSFNVQGGRCEACEGDGLIKVEMHFLPDVYVACDTCHGKRYNRETLEIHFKGKNISDALQMTVEEAHKFFSAVPTIKRKLDTLMDVGLGYVRLGQSATTLSGGEAQRVKLALELSKRDTGRTLYILDEPTTGLHFHDIAMLLKVLYRLRDQGNTIVVIEHNLEVIKTADWLIDLGPEGGDGGGQIVATGTPEQLAENTKSYTGRYLKPLLARSSNKAAPTKKSTTKK